jgi:hypothetical protein
MHRVVCALLRKHARGHAEPLGVWRHGHERRCSGKRDGCGSKDLGCKCDSWRRRAIECCGSGRNEHAGCGGTDEYSGNGGRRGADGGRDVGGFGGNRCGVFVKRHIRKMVFSFCSERGKGLESFWCLASTARGPFGLCIASSHLAFRKRKVEEVDYIPHSPSIGKNNILIMSSWFDR